MIGNYLNPQNDIAFKRLFGTKKNKDILISLLNEVLKNQLQKQIKEVIFLSPIQLPEALENKQSIVDVLCEDTDGVQFIVEMQVAQTKGFEARAQFYASKAFISQMNVGGKYENLKEVIFLAFCNFNVFPKKKAYKSEHVILDRNTGENDLDKLSFTFVDLKKFAQQRSKEIRKLTEEEKFYYFLTNADQITPEQLEFLTLKNHIIKKAIGELDRCFWTKNQIRLYEKEQKNVWDSAAQLRCAKDKGKVEGIAEGLKKGEALGKQSIINELLANGTISQEEANRIFNKK